MQPGQRGQQRAEAPGMQADPLRPQCDGPERERQHERSQHLGIELVEVEEKRRHEREAERERGGEARAVGGVTHQLEQAATSQAPSAQKSSTLTATRPASPRARFSARSTRSVGASRSDGPGASTE